MKMPEATNEVKKTDPAKRRVRVAVDTFKDLQAVRMQIGNRICAAFRDETEVNSDSEEDDKVKAKMSKELVSEYQRITDYYADIMLNHGRIDRAIKGVDGLQYIRNDQDYTMVKAYYMSLQNEAAARESMEKEVKKHPMWDGFFKDVKGCGPSIAGQLIAYLDVHEARHVSSFWSYCGVGTRNKDGERVAMSKKALVDVEYVDKNGEVKTKKSVGYNPACQSVLLSVFVDSVIKTAKGSKYNECYYDYKNRYANMEKYKDASKMHIHRMAARQTAKALLRDLWVAWRSYEGYELSRPYEVEYLGKAPHKYNEAHNDAATL
jgi:hypothetical protein